MNQVEKDVQTQVENKVTLNTANGPVITTYPNTPEGRGKMFVLIESYVFSHKSFTVTHGNLK